MKRTIKKIAVLGGSGKSGKYLVKQLLHEGYLIKVLARNPEKRQMHDSAVEIIRGNATEFKSVSRLINNTDAVISMLGLGVPPSEPTVFSAATENILKAMAIHGTTRYIVITGLNVDAPGDEKGPDTRGATEWMYSNYPKSTADRQLEYRLLTESSLEWTLVRLPLIDQTDAKEDIVASLEDCPGTRISATSLALFLIEQLTDVTFIRKAPFLANA